MYFAKTQPGPSKKLLAQKNKDKTNKSYDIPGVREQLAKDFYDKCYICGFESTSMRIEHFRPHRGNRDKMFDWKNLFYACEHCNSLKSDGFETLLDCTKIKAIDELIEFSYDPGKGNRQKILITDVDSKSPDTVELLQLVFSAKNTPTKKQGAKLLEKKLGVALRDFRKINAAYNKDPNKANEALLKHEVNNQSEFAAFKRWLVKKNPQEFRAQIVTWFVN